MALGDYRGPARADAWVRYAVSLLKTRMEERSFRMRVAESVRLYPQGMYLADPWRPIAEKKRDFDADAIMERVLAQHGPDAQ